jgi:hypothetical protein
MSSIGLDENVLLDCRLLKEAMHERTVVDEYEGAAAIGEV